MERVIEAKSAKKIILLADFTIFFTNTIDILEYNAGAMACTKSELIIMYLQSIGMAGSISEKKFNATILEDKYK